MRIHHVFTGILFCLVCSSSELAAQAPPETAFTYQGRLEDDGSPASGLHDFRFRLWDAATSGEPVGPAIYADSVKLNDGLFTISLDFGAQFAGKQRFLEVEVRAHASYTDSGATFVTLRPRQAITATPYATFAARPWATAGSDISYDAGNVGIGTRNPASKLDIAGMVRATGLQLPTGAGRLTIDPRDIPRWSAATAYEVGDVVAHTLTPTDDVTIYWDWGFNQGWCFSYVLMTCTTAGTSGSPNAPPFTAIGATDVVDNDVRWTFIKSNRRVLEIYDHGNQSRSNGPESWFRGNGSYASFRGMTLSGTSNGMAGDDYDLFDPFLPRGETAGWGNWIGIVADGSNQVLLALNVSRQPNLGFTNTTPMIIGSGYPAQGVGQEYANVFHAAIDWRGGLNWTGTYGTSLTGDGAETILGHLSNTTDPTADPGFAIRLWPDATGKSLIQGGASGAAAGNAATGARAVYRKLAMADDTPTDVLRVSVPNVEASAVLELTILGRASDGEATRCAKGLVVFNRKAAGSNVVANTATLTLTQTAVDGAQPITVAYSLRDNGETAGALQTFDLQITINTNNSATGECTVLANLINHQADGAYMGPR